MSERDMSKDREAFDRLFANLKATNQQSATVASAQVMYREVFLASLHGAAAHVYASVSETGAQDLVEDAHELARTAVSYWYGEDVAGHVAGNLEEIK